MSGTIRDFRDLIVWRKSIRHAREIHQFTERWPDRERFGLTIQVRRAAVAISPHIAKGHSRTGRKFLRHLSIARGVTGRVGDSTPARR